MNKEVREYDSSGYRFPVYLTAWGSGMNALNTYLMIPFMAVFGAEVWVGSVLWAVSFWH